MTMDFYDIYDFTIEEFNPLKINYGDTLKVDYPTGSSQPALTLLHYSP